MNNIPENILDLLLIYTSKKGVNESEFNILKHWIDESPENKKLFSDYLLFYKKSRTIGFAENADKNKAWQNVIAQLQTPLDNIENVKKPNSKIRFLNFSTSVLKYAAVILILLSAGYFVLQNNNKSKETFIAPENAITLQLENGEIQIIKDDGTSQVVDANGKVVGEQKGNVIAYNNSSSKETLVYNIIKVPYGKRFQLKLSDGTNVHLNAGTTLKYPVRFIAEENRQVFLDGEAYFDVTKDPTHPFVVTSEDMDIKVLGTHFNVTSYTKDQKTYTVLVEGSVLAANNLIPNDQVLLKPGNRAYFDNKNLKTEPVDVRKYIAWISGELMFIDDSFAVISNKLERNYNVEIINNYKALDDIMVTATFKNENIYEVLKTFQTYKAFDFTINNRVITINKPKKM